MRRAACWWLFAAILSFILVLPACPPDDDDDDDDATDDDVDDDADDDVDDDVADDDADDDVGDDTGDDDTGDDDTGAEEPPLVFVQVTDIHQSRESGTNKGQYDAWLKSLVYVHDVVAPDFVIATGDLTDASNGNQQHQGEWDDYRNAILNAGFTTDEYYDVPGNHDAADDGEFTYYLANGITQQLNHSWEIEKGGHRYAFVAVTTAHDGGIGGRVTRELYDWTRARFESVAPGATHLFLFAHHNGPLIPDAGFLGAGGLLDEFDVTGYIAGHHHIDLEFSENGTRFVKTYHHYRGMPDSDDGWMRIVVLSGTTWATRTAYVVDRGPQVVIARPQDKRLAVTRSPDDHIVSGPTEVIALAFAEDAVSLVMSVDGGAAAPLATEDGRLFSGEFDFYSVPPGEHTIRVEDPDRTDNTNGVDEITVESVVW